MNIATATTRTKAALQSLETAIGEPVFDEWALTEKTSSGWKLTEPEKILTELLATSKA